MGDLAGRQFPQPPHVRCLFAYALSGILGIRPAADPTGSAPLLIAPKTPEGLRFAEGYTTLPGGRLSVSWRREAAQIRFTVTVPEKQTAVFRYGETAMPLHSGTNHFLCAQETGA